MRTAVGVAALSAILVGCGAHEPRPGNETTTPPHDPAERAVRIETSGCGFAPDRTGSGVAIGDGLVVTVAHLVARADKIEAVVGNRAAVEATVAAVDLDRDLAVLRFTPDGIPVLEMSSDLAAIGTGGRIVGAASSGTVPFEVEEVVNVSIEEILGTDRHSRLGYKLSAATTTGDSGAGAYDSDNKLIGIVFAIDEAGESTWITSSAEIDKFIAAHRSDASPIVCDTASSQLDLP